MRSELAEAVSGVLGTVDAQETFDLTDAEEDHLLQAADLVTLCRTAVMVDYQGNPIDAHAPEMPTRFAKQLKQMVRGGLAIGMSRDAAMRLAIRCARDSMPKMRLAILEDLKANPASKTADIWRRLDKPRTTVDRQLIALHLLRALTFDDVVESEDDEDSDEGSKQKTTRWYYSLREGIDPCVLSVSEVVLGGVPGTSVDGGGVPGTSVDVEEALPFGNHPVPVT